MLARLSLTDDLIDWSNASAVEKLRIIDPACGTGTLLMASLQTIKSLVAGRGEGDMTEEQRNALHKRIVEDVLCGLDINQHGIQLAACNMTLGAPTVDYERMNLVTMPHGPQGDGSPKAGSLEILTAADDAQDLSTVTHSAPQRSLETLDAEQVSESEEIRFPMHDLDGVIMNAPFTDNMKRGRKFSRAALNAMQRHEIEIRNRLHERDPGAAAVITTNSISKSTFFTPLAEKLLRSDRAFLAKVLPVTACTSASGVEERRFLAERFHIERIVTSHDPRRIAFSENTSIHESLLICRRAGGRKDRPPTEFVSLRKMPTTAKEAIEVAEAIAAGAVGDWGSVCRWPADRVQAGDWTPAQWYDGGLATTIRRIETSPLLEPVGLRNAIGPAGQRIRDTYRKSEPDEAGAVRLFSSISSDLRRKMRGEAEDWRSPKSGKEDLANRYCQARSHLLVAQRYDTVGGRLTSLWTRSPSVGSGWMPVGVGDEDRAKALAAWWNSTPVRLILLNQRAKKLTYAAWSLAHLRQIRVPKPDNPAWEALQDAFDLTSDDDLLPMRLADECQVRQIIDEAASLAISVEEDVVADWRRRLAAEPTITNARAPQLSESRER